MLSVLRSDIKTYKDTKNGHLSKTHVQHVLELTLGRNLSHLSALIFNIGIKNIKFQTLTFFFPLTLYFIGMIDVDYLDFSVSSEKFEHKSFLGMLQNSLSVIAKVPVLK